MPKASKPRRSSPRFEFNGGLIGAPRPAANTAAVERCTVHGCGTAVDPTDRRKPQRGMVRVHVPGTGEPARWYCPGRCAAIGRALAEVRGIDRQDGGETE
ncbi:hypothetical protein SEA_KROMP_44 [Streptomyces phage Kromp]|uniref:Uncharacterized protein n=1 Tax=Streptomyces phage Kromp TaxID=2315619 RepID=A0A386K8T8_9CAUD|nr:hypothetical protein SEA_KROMP_44 [Streptomyces phage Kromp]